MKNLPVYPYIKPPELDGGTLASWPVVVVGAGLSGLALALDLARRGVRVLVLDDDNTVGVRGLASRGMVWAQRTLDILDRLGVADVLVEKGVRWNLGRVLCRDVCVTTFKLQEQPDLHHNGFVNAQQYYLESFLVDALQREPLAELRWLNRVESVVQDEDGATLTVQTPDGTYTCRAQWLAACDGAHSRVRASLGLHPQVFDHAPKRKPGRARRAQARQSFDGGEDRWIIIDIVLRDSEWPAERWTWLDAGSNRGLGVWRHKMADDTWRLDFQLHPDEDAEVAGAEPAMRQRVWDLLGEKVEFDIAWHGVWAYRHECLEQLRHGKVLFVGDSAHLVAPWGARGGNGGIQDADNLGWKLALLIQGKTDARILDSYSVERKLAAMENIRQARRSSRFVYPAPHPEVKLWRDAVLALAPEHAFAARMVNTGRLSAPAIYPDSALAHAASPHGGRALANVVLHQSPALPLHRLLGPWFTALVFADHLPAAVHDTPLLSWVAVGAHCDAQGRAALARQLGVQVQGEVWLIRPDQHVLATWGALSADLHAKIEACVRAALSQDAVATQTHAGVPPDAGAFSLQSVQQQHDDLFERLLGVTNVADGQLREARLAQLVLLLMEALGDIARVHAVVADIEARHATAAHIPIP